MSRYYNTPGGEYASVTTVLDLLDKSMALVPWAVGLTVRYLHEHIEELQGDITEERVKEIIAASKGQYKEKSAEALDIGSRTHQAIEAWLKNEPMTLTNDIQAPFMAFLEWATARDFSVIATERTVINDAYRYAGTCDLVGMLDGKKYVIDLKTSKAFYEPSMPMQVAAYAHCLEGVEGIGVLRLDKLTGVPEWKDYTEGREGYLDGFLSLVNVFYRFYAKKKLRRAA